MMSSIFMIPFLEIQFNVINPSTNFILRFNIFLLTLTEIEDFTSFSVNIFDASIYLSEVLTPNLKEPWSLKRLENAKGSSIEKCF